MNEGPTGVRLGYHFGQEMCQAYGLYRLSSKADRAHATNDVSATSDSPPKAAKNETLGCFGRAEWSEVPFS